MSRIHIRSPSGYYIGQARKAGQRSWETVAGNRYETPEDALVMLAAKMDGMKRGRVLFIDDSGYYEPRIVMEVNRA